MVPSLRGSVGAYCDRLPALAISPDTGKAKEAESPTRFDETAFTRVVAFLVDKRHWSTNSRKTEPELAFGGNSSWKQA